MVIYARMTSKSLEDSCKMVISITLINNNFFHDVLKKRKNDFELMAPICF